MINKFSNAARKMLAKLENMRVHVFLLVLCCPFNSALAQNAAINDGPYVFWHNKHMVLKSVERNGESVITKVDSFKISGKVNHLLNVHVDAHPEWDFKVKLKGQIINEPAVATGADKILALSDIEGEFEPFRNLLVANKVIDAKYNWTFGKGQLIIAGDLFDRGKQVSQFLWLLYKLEDEAKAAGGYVHVVLGNHDIMNLGGDFRYVQPEYKANAALMQKEYKDLYGVNTELGRWLRSKNVVEKIGGFLVLHGGVSPELLAQHLSIARINELARPYYDRWVQVKNDTTRLLFGGTTSPFWYRGYFIAPKASEALIDSTLTFYGCKRILVGHDIIDHVNLLYSGKVIGIDVNQHEGTHEALLIENKKYYRVDDRGNKTELSHN